VICSSPRTGSGLLGSALWSTGLCGRPDEYLAPATRRDYEGTWGCRTDREYAEQVVSYATTPNGVLSLKVHRSQVQRADWLAHGSVVRGRGSADPFLALAPIVHFVWVSRRDKVRQAVSLYVAEKTGRYRQLGERSALATASIDFDEEGIHRLVDQIEGWEQSWQRYFDSLGVGPLRIWYEDHLEHAYAETTRRVLETIGVEVPREFTVTTEYRKQSDDRSEMLVRRYRERERGARRD
jgi:LPS sulfotransferase NodH